MTMAMLPEHDGVVTMTIAEQILAFYRHHARIDVSHGGYCMTIDLARLIEECNERGIVTQDWENESTEFDFADGSVLIVNNSDINIYGSR